MTGDREGSSLPFVKDEHFTLVLFEEIIDPDHSARYERLRESNPRLIREIVRRAYIDAHEMLENTDHSLMHMLDLQKIIINSVTFALNVIELALKNQNDINDAGDDEDQPHSNEPGDDQPTG